MGFVLLLKFQLRRRSDLRNWLAKTQWDTTFSNWIRFTPREHSTHHRGTYHCTADLLFERLGFGKTSKSVVDET